MQTQIEPRQHLLAFVALKHVEQRRKYTNEPYLFHLTSVAKMADGKCLMGYEIGLCHDLLEDTDCTMHELRDALKRFGYNDFEIICILRPVVALTDIWTPQYAPVLNRAKRKKLEAERLHIVSYEAQTVKYCDIINNAESILEHDPKFGKTYIAEMKYVLEGMNKGHKGLYKKALKAVNQNI